MSLFNPKSVVDVGCGTGTFLKEFKINGVEQLKGYDGSWANEELLAENLNESEFEACDLEKSMEFEHKYDLALCLEVAEHLEESSADILIDNLTKSSDVIVFSAAIPGQGGQNHVNEQWLDYWRAKFDAKGFVVDDVLKPLLWNNQKIDYWYRQNIVIVRKSGYKYEKPEVENMLQNPIHEQLFTERTAKYNELKDGKARPKLYLKLFLKSIFNKS